MATEFTTYFNCGSRLTWTYPGAGRSGEEKRVFNDGTRQSIIYNPTQNPVSMEYDGLFDALAGVSQPPVVADAPTKGEHTDFNWLTYVPGKTTVQQLQQANVLTGPMSGCLLIVWKPDAMNGQSLCHVGTNYDDPASTRTVKQDFDRVITSESTGFKPDAAWELKEISTPMIKLSTGPNAGQVSFKIFGLVTTAGKFYSIIMFQMLAQGQNIWCAGGIKEVPPMTFQDLKQKLAT